MEKGYEIKVLDTGYVRLVDSLGSDESIIEAARMSTGKGFVSWDEYTRCKQCDWYSTAPYGHDFHACPVHGPDEAQEYPRGDLGLLDYLYKMRHTSPFEMCELIIDVQIPMDAWRQWIRHRTASVNEYSTRYSEAIDVASRTAPDAWRTQGKTNRQGSGAFLDAETGTHLTEQEDEFLNFARHIYEERLRLGVAKEQARKDLPLSTNTAARWKCDLHNLLHFLRLRMHPHAQLEIRSYAEAVATIVKALWPRTYALFEEYTLHSVSLSRTEVEHLRTFVKTHEGCIPPSSLEATLRKKLLGV